MSGLPDDDYFALTDRVCDDLERARHAKPPIGPTTARQAARLDLMTNATAAALDLLLECPGCKMTSLRLKSSGVEQRT